MAYLAHEEKIGNVTMKIYHDEYAENPFMEWDMSTTLLTWHSRASFSTEKLSDFGVHGSRTSGFYYYTESGEEWYFNSTQEIGEFLRKDGSEVLPVYVYEHGGMTISTKPFGDPWDSGQMGFILMTPDAIKSELSIWRSGFPKDRRELFSQSRVMTSDHERGDPQRKVWTEYFNTFTQQWTRDQVWWRKHVYITKADREAARERMESDISTLDQYLTGDVYGFVIEDDDGDEADNCWGFYGMDCVIAEARAVAVAESQRIDMKRERERKEIADLEAEIEEMRYLETGEWREIA